MTSGPVGYRRGPVIGTLRGAALVVGALVFLLPFYLLLRNGLAAEEELTAPDYSLLPRELHWENFGALLSDENLNLLGALGNSVVVSVLQTLGQLVLCGLAGYGLARISYRHTNKVFFVVIATLMIPPAITFVPNFIVVSSLGWISDLRGLIIPGLFSGFTTFLFRQYFLNFPRELEEAARVDGLGTWGTFWRIVVPNSWPFVVALGVIAFIGSWNAFLWPLVIGQDDSSQTVQVALSYYLNDNSSTVSLLFLGAALSIVPLVAVFALLQRYLVRGVTESGLAGN